VKQGRGNSTQRGYTYRWQQVRLRFLREHPLCVACEAEGKIGVATEVDHIIPHRGNMALFWKPDNWQPLCKPHHSVKTQVELGGKARLRPHVGVDGWPIKTARGE
jgi:5-methylcytosine-specific restriction protein A